MTNQLLHSTLAKYYDKIHSFRDYLDEAVRLQNLIIKYSPIEPLTILDVACGTGLHLKYLKDDFECTGLDISKDMLKLARKNTKGITFKHGDMKKFKLKKQFDVITCLLSSIGYIRTQTNLNKTLKNLYSHTAKGGILILEPSDVKSFYVSGNPKITTFDGNNTKITRINITKIKSKIAQLNMYLVIAEKGKEPKYHIDTHKLGIFSAKDTIKAMRNAGFRSKFLANGLMTGRELLVGIRR